MVFGFWDDCKITKNKIPDSIKKTNNKFVELENYPIFIIILPKLENCLIS